MSELTAALATIEKLRAERDQLAAENVALKGAISAVNRTAEECEVNGDELKYVVEPSEFEALTDLLGETPATDRIYAGIKADGVDEWVSSRGGRWNGTTEEALKFAEQLRKGASE